MNTYPLLERLSSPHARPNQRHGTQALAVLVAAGALLLTGCTSDNDRPAPIPTAISPSAAPTKRSSTIWPPPFCAATNLEGWSDAPRDLDVATIAEVLDVPRQDVTRGKFGSAHCDVPIPSETIDQGQRVYVTGLPSNAISGMCMAIQGRLEPTTTAPAAAATDISVVCPLRRSVLPV